MARYSCLPIALLLAFSPNISNASDCKHTPEASEGVKIGEVTIDNKNIFDTSQSDQSSWLHQAANYLHIKTTKETIESQLLFKKGDEYSEQLMAETQRLIRANKYINDVEIKTDTHCEGEAKVAIVSTDNWTFTPSVSVGHSGGVTRTSYEITESNILGLGSQVKLKSDSDEFRTTNLFAYNDNNLFDDHNRISLDIARNSDGHRDAVSFGRPFYKLKAEYAWSFSLLDGQREDPIYDAGIVVDSIGNKEKQLKFSYGWLARSGSDNVSRYNLGWSQTAATYFNATEFPASVLPNDRESNYPFLQYQYVQDEHIVKSNFMVMGAPEDISLGDRFTVSAGWQDEIFNASENGLVLSLDYLFGSQFSDKSLGLFEFRLNQQINESKFDPLVASINSRFFIFEDENHSYQFSNSIEFSDDAQVNEAFHLGGDSGFKGYPVRFQSGNRKVAFAVEKRRYINWYPLQMLKLGFAAFAEVGSAWSAGDKPVVISDVGFGLRLVSTRQSDSKVLHLDLAFPTSERDQVDSYQLFIKAQSQF